MTYREDDDALRGRVDALEAELARARGEIASLRGEASAPHEPGAEVTHSRLLGGPSGFAREVALPYEIDARGYEAIAKVLRARLGMNASQVGRELTVPGRFSLTHDGERTRIRLASDWSSDARGIGAIAVISAGFSSVLTAGALADAAPHGTMMVALIAAMASVATVVPSLLMRRRIAKLAQQRLADGEGTFAAIVELAREHRIAPRARVEIESENEDESEGESARQKRA